jgi:hypothetical protein
MDVAAEAQGGSNLTLLVAVVGILGALAAAVITQWLTTRREEHKWQREREQDDHRWEQELAREEKRAERDRQERADQWKREDSARLYSARLTAYSAVVAAGMKVDKHIGILWNLIVQEAYDSGLPSSETDPIPRFYEQLVELVEPLAVIGSMEVWLRAQDLLKEISEVMIVINSHGLNYPHQVGMIYGIEKHHMKIEDTVRELKYFARQDLGSEDRPDRRRRSSSQN